MCTDTFEYTLRWECGVLDWSRQTLGLVLGEAYMWMGFATLGRSAKQLTSTNSTEPDLWQSSGRGFLIDYHDDGIIRSTQLVQ